MKLASKTTLIIVHPHFTIPGGAGKMVLELGKRISKKINVVIVAQKINPDTIKNYPEIKFESLNGPITSSFKFWLLLSYWRKKTYDVIDKYKAKGKIEILCNTFPANWIGLPYKKQHPEIKCFWLCQEPSAFIHIKKWRNAIVNPLKRIIANSMSPLFAIYDKGISKYSDIFFVNSHFSQKKTREVYNREAVVIYPGIDVKKFQPIKYKDKENYILTVARLSKFKNIDMLIRAFARLKKSNLKLRIVGDGEEKSNLLELARSLNISKRVEILSGLDDKEVADLYAKAKMFVLCSIEEPFGMVPVEALASGTMAIADNSGGPREIIQDNINGILIDNMNEKKLSKCIDSLFKDEAKIKYYSSNARSGVVDLFTWDKSANKILEYL